MRTIQMLLLLIMLPVLSFGQKDPCRKIKRSVSSLGVVYKSPELKYVSVIREYKAGEVFCLYMRFKDHADHYGRQGATIEFDDGTKIIDEGTQVDCIQELTTLNGGATASLSHSGTYTVQGFFNITDANIEKFVKRKVVNVCLDNAVQKILDNDAVRLRSYIRCMRDMKRESALNP